MIDPPFLNRGRAFWTVKSVPLTLTFKGFVKMRFRDRTHGDPLADAVRWRRGR